MDSLMTTGQSRVHFQASFVVFFCNFLSHQRFTPGKKSNNNNNNSWLLVRQSGTRWAAICVIQTHRRTQDFILEGIHREDREFSKRVEPGDLGDRSPPEAEAIVWNYVQFLTRFAVQNNSVIVPCYNFPLSFSSPLCCEHVVLYTIHSLYSVNWRCCSVLGWQRCWVDSVSNTRQWPSFPTWQRVRLLPGYSYLRFLYTVESH